MFAISLEISLYRIRARLKPPVWLTSLKLERTFLPRKNDMPSGIIYGVLVRLSTSYQNIDC